MRRAGILIVTAVALLAAAPPAGAYVLGGPRWPQRTITYWDGGPDRAAVRAAVRAWGESGALVRFRPAPRSHADVWITRWPRRCRGYAQIGFDPGKRRARLRLGPCDDLAESTGVVAHELGHVLGLGHERRRCAAMNPIVAERCPPLQLYHAACEPLLRDDARGAVALYGGRVRVGPRRACPRFGPPLPPAELRVTPAADGTGMLELRLAERRTLIRGSGPPPRRLILVNRYEGGCPPATPSGAADASSDVQESRVGIPVELGPGPVCFAVRVTDTTGGPTAVATVSAE